MVTPIHPKEYATVKLIFRRNFAVILPSRTEWKTGDMSRDYKTIFLTNRLNMIREVGAGVFEDMFSVARPYGFPGCDSVFQMNLLAILEAY